MSHLTSVLEHYQNVLELTGQTTNYKKVGVVLQAQAEATLDQYETSKAYYEMLQEQREIIESDMAQAEAANDEAALELIRQKWYDIIEACDDAEEDMVSNLEEYADLVNSILTNALSEAADTLEKTLTNGMGYDALNDAMDLTS
jgi:hypothetical protein